MITLFKNLGSEKWWSKNMIIKAITEHQEYTDIRQQNIKSPILTSVLQILVKCSIPMSSAIAIPIK